MRDINPVVKLQQIMTPLPLPKLPLITQPAPILPPASTAIQGSSNLAPVNVDDGDLTSKVDKVASIADTVDSTAAPAAPTVIQGLSKLKLVDIDADDLASMIDTIDAPSDSSSDSSSNSSISEDPPDNTQEGPFNCHKVFYSGAYYVDPPDDMETGCPEEAPDPVMDDVTMPDHSTTPLLSVGDHQQTLGDGPPITPQGTH